MDARDRLRRYIEQRKELGESEFVLDELPVDDLMRMIGMRGAARSSTSPQQPSDSASPPVPTQRPQQVADAADSVREEIPFEYKAPADNSERASSERAANASSASDAPVANQPPTPEVRFDSNASTDWRTTLAGLGPTAGAPASSRPPVAPPSANAPPLADWLAALAIPSGLVAGARQESSATAALANLTDLGAVADAIRVCKACALHATALNPVPGEGDPNADFMCVGEAPGEKEDEAGRPFYGPAGQLLTKILGAIKLSREEVFICNVLKHRPPGNRNPLPDEVRACSPYLMRQLDLVQPRVILALGTFAAQTLLETTLSIGKLRGQIHRYRGIPLIVTYHPAALLRNEAWKRPAWDDVKLARRILDASRAANPSA